MLAARALASVINISDKSIGLEYISSFAFAGIGRATEKNSRDNIKVYIPHNAWMREIDWKILSAKVYL